MFSGKRNFLRNSAAWRIAALAGGGLCGRRCPCACHHVRLIARDIHARSDAWLSGEAETLADVSAKTPRDSLYGRLVQEVAELATHEVADPSLSGQQQNSVFFLQMQPNEEPIWVGPSPKQRFIRRLNRRNWRPEFLAMCMLMDGSCRFGLSITRTVLLLASTSVSPTCRARRCSTV